MCLGRRGTVSEPTFPAASWGPAAQGPLPALPGRQPPAGVGNGSRAAGKGGFSYVTNKASFKRTPYGSKDVLSNDSISGINMQSLRRSQLPSVLTFQYFCFSEKPGHYLLIAPQFHLRDGMYSHHMPRKH